MSTSKPSRKEITHERILEVAARAIRRAGYDGVGVADIMKEANLTHGGYYAHFSSRDAMLVEAIERAGRESNEALGRRVAARQAHGASRLRALLESYLSDAHLASTETGCVVAALLSEMPRQAEEVRSASSTRLRALIAMVENALPDGADKADAAVVASAMVGALQLARAMDTPRAGKALLASTREALIAQYDKQGDKQDNNAPTRKH